MTSHHDQICWFSEEDFMLRSFVHKSLAFIHVYILKHPILQRGKIDFVGEVTEGLIDIQLLDYTYSYYILTIYLCSFLTEYGDMFHWKKTFSNFYQGGRYFTFKFKLIHLLIIGILSPCNIKLRVG